MDSTPQKHVYIRTFGCQMNVHDSTKIELMLSSHGYVLTDNPEDADLILYNTCTIREKAHHKAISEIGRSRLFKEKNPDVLIGVCGCVAQQDKTALFEIYPHIDLLFGPDQIWRLPELITKARACGRAFALDLINDPLEYRFSGLDSDPRYRATSDGQRATAFVSIIKGCNCACSYCIVPKVRGREVCRAPEEILDEVTMLTDMGVKEIVLLGQNVNAYDFRSCGTKSAGTGFADLIRMITDKTPVRRIRFTSPHPKDVNEDLIREYVENEKLCPHIHLPMQAGSNDTLKKMRRGYTRERCFEICDSLRTARPGMAITTDLIVGFCDETRKGFEDTIDMMRRIEFDSIFAFKYSPRPGTEAAEKFEDNVSEAEKDERLRLVLELQREISRNHNESLIGTCHDVLVYGLDRMKRGLLTGRIPDNRIVHFAGNSSQIGDIVPVRIKGAHKNSLAGEVVA